MDLIRAKRASLSLDMAPLIDVVFQLLIFFMLSSSFAVPALRLTLPRATIKDSPQPERLVISVDHAGQIFVNSAPVVLDNLVAVLSAHLYEGGAAQAVHIRGDADMPYGRFVQVMDAARQAGARQINILHQGDQP
jgi:biopolymer transport protein ExbD